MYKKEDYAWCAGFLDADGSFSMRVYNNKNKRKMIQPVIQVSQLKKDNLIKLLKISECSKKEVWDCIYKHTNGKSNVRYYKISIIGKDRLTKFTNNIYPYMCSKKKQCKYMIYALRHTGHRGTNKYSDKHWRLFFNIKKMIEKLNARTKFKIEYDPK